MKLRKRKGSPHHHPHHVYTHCDISYEFHHRVLFVGVYFFCRLIGLVQFTSINRIDYYCNLLIFFFFCEKEKLFWLRKHILNVITLWVVMNMRNVKLYVGVKCDDDERWTVEWIDDSWFLKKSELRRKKKCNKNQRRDSMDVFERWV